MGNGTVWAVVPVKPFRDAKFRLAPVLDAGERAALARVMLEDVLGVLAASADRLAGVMVLTADREAAAMARRFDAAVLVETAPAGLNGAVTIAAAHVAENAAAGMLVIPGDLPHLSGAAIAQITELLDAPRSVALLPASGDAGTNLFACRPANVIPPRFGPSSFKRHLAETRRAGITARVLTCPRLGRDIDRPDDLAAFLAMGTATRTHAYLSTLEIADRLLRRPVHHEGTKFTKNTISLGQRA